MKRALVALALFTACGGAPPHAQSPTPASFGQLAARLDHASTHCGNTCCQEMRALPDWITGWWSAGIDSDEAARRATIRVLEHAGDPRVVALAAIRLGRFARAEDIPRLAQLLHRTEPGAALPTAPPMSQQPVFCPSPATTRFTLGQTALLALEKPAGQRFHSVAEFETWRAHHRNDADYWEDLLNGNPSVIAKRLKAADPDMYCRIALAPRDRDSGATAAFDDKERLRCGRAVGADRLLALVSGADRSWPELANDDRRGSFSEYVLDHAEQLLRPDQADRLLALRSDPRLPSTLLAIAASRLAPARRHAILLSADQTGGAAAELARWFPGRERARIVADFYAHDWYENDILNAIEKAGPPARALLRDIVGDARFPADNYSLAKAVAETARAVVPGAKLECEGLWPGGKELGRVAPAVRETRIGNAKAAARRCTAKLVQLLR